MKSPRRGSALLCGALGALGALVMLVACARGGLASIDEAPLTRAAVAANPASPGCPACDADPTRYLRQLSLDLRGRPPSMAELEDVARTGQVAPECIDAMLASDEFLTQVKRWHAAALWPSVGDLRRIQGGDLTATLPSQNTLARLVTVSPDPLLWKDGAKNPRAVVQFLDTRNLRGGEAAVGCDDRLEYPAPAARGKPPSYAVLGTDGKRRTYPYYDDRGVPLPYHDAAHCPNFCSSKSDEERAAPGFEAGTPMFADMNAQGADAKPAELDPPGKHCPASHPYRVVNACDNTQHSAGDRRFRYRQDGFRWMTHYWSHGQPIKTCSYEAQTRTVSLADGKPCAQHGDETCGCGPDGMYCMPTIGSGAAVDRESHTEHAIRAALEGEALQIVASVVARDEDYFDAFTTRRSFATGPLSFFFKHQTEAARAPYEMSAPAPPDQLPDAPFQDETWHEYVRGPEHSGVLTTVAYLLRFPTWRSRVSQFRTEFMCRPFTPAVASFPGPDDPCTREPNLARRCGCRNCHAALEPMTAWFARWSERSAKYLSPEEYPRFNPECTTCAVTHQCAPQCLPYAIDATDADGLRFAGTLRGYLYRTPDEQERIDEGPRGLVESAIASGELESCTVRTAWSRLVGRAMSDDEVRDRLPDLERAFESRHRSYRALVRAIVTAPEYRRVQ